MEKLKRFIGYFYCFIVIIISIFIIIKTDFLSRFMLRGLERELLPVLSMDKVKGEEFLYELIPMLAIGREEYSDESDLSYDDFLEYDYASRDNSVFSEDGLPFDKDENNSEEGNNLSDENGDTILNDGNSEEASEEEQTEEINNEEPGNQTDNLYVTALAGMNPNGIYYSMDQLNNYDFMLKNCYAVDSSTSVLPEEIDADTLLNKDMSIDLTGDGYKVLIYHTHGSEAFSDSREGVTEDTVIGVGDELTRILEEDYGIKTYHDRNVYDVVNGVLDRSYAYTLSGAAVDRILAENPTIEVIIDLHRDGVREDLKLMRVIDGRPTAQIMFLNGVSRLNLNGDIDYLYNPNKIDNLAFSLQMHLAGKAMYGDLLRRIYIRGYSFNLEKMPRATLVEVGAQTNTVEEAKNAMIPLAAILNSVLRKE
ncbi:MAG: stage II sporulation protein P [Lachnospiraceae bacterium]|nr:stage II sporulation protein P [Lachnospiraceae bacterium]